MNKRIIFSILPLFLIVSCDKGQSPVAQQATVAQQAPVSNNLKDQTQLAFEARAMPIVKANTQKTLGTRESEEAFQKSNEFWKSVAGMEVKNWKCRYVENFPWEPRGDSNPEIRCVNPNDKDSLSAFNNGKYILKIMASSFPQKIYNGDLITFSGTSTGGNSTGYVQNKTNYDLFVNVSSISVGAN